MKSFKTSIVFVAYASAFLLTTFILRTAECKTVSSRVPQASSSNPSSNVFYSVARSLATEAMSNFKENSRRNPRLGFNITMLLPPSFVNATNPNATNLIGTLFDTTTRLGVIGLKGGILGLKAAIIQSIVLILFIVFLLTGIAYFACNIGIISCTNVGSSLSNLGGGLGGASLGQITGGANPFARAGYDYHQNLHRSTSNVYNALDDGQKKYT